MDIIQNEVNMKILLNKVEDMDDWYTIIRAEHEGKEWIEKISENCSAYRNSERLDGKGQASIEGTRDHILGIAIAIQEKSAVSFKRIAVSYSKENNGFFFWSPKNSEIPVLIPLEDAENLMRQIYEKLGKP